MPIILDPEQLKTTDVICELRLPVLDLFARRARRLRQLAVGHSMRSYLEFAAALADAQQQQLDQLRALPIPDQNVLERCREHAMPPLAPAGWRRDPIWRTVATRLTEALDAVAPAPARAAFARLRAAEPDWMEAQADALLAEHRAMLDLACVPVIGAALQVCWTKMAAALDAAWIATPATPALCPVCGMPPVASVVGGAGDADSGLRYLHCALCGSEWHAVRAQCSQCDNDKGLVYYAVESYSHPIQAEACPECGSYLKLCRRDQEIDMEPLADDLASLALDVLMSEQKFARSGVNYWLLQSE
ncbi:MAG: formate dehydrogenase accessory protein FdhE [Candidatus Competibacteraceae bacterium]|nr:formate dehydrogenase accessory protein FdhE [Candidatus Competibacteraceae bacterium]